MKPQKALDTTTIENLTAGRLDKVELAQQVGAYLSKSDDQKDRSVVENLARVLAQDVSQLVRQTLAEELRNCSFLPADVAERIAHDVEDVAVPFLKATEVFAAGELARLVPNIQEYARVAVAGREHVPAEVSQAIASFGGERSVSVLMENEGADVCPSAYATVIERFAEDNYIMDSLASRKDLPLAIVESVVAHVSETIREDLVECYGVSRDLAHMLSEEARVRSLAGVLDSATLDQIGAHVRDLANRNALTPSTILSLVEKGNRRFFEVAMAELVGIPLTNVRALMRSGGNTGIERLLSCAGFGDMYVPLFESALAKLPRERRH